jgi:stage III sporulation protein AG
MKIDLSLFRGKGESLLAALKKCWPLLAALLLGLLLLSLPRTGQNRDTKEEAAPAFSLEAEEEKLARALEKLEGVGSVTVVLTLKSSMERQLASDGSSHWKSQENGTETQTESETVRLQAGSGVQEPIVLRWVYPEYKGALIVAERLTPTGKLEITNAVAALTGLATDKITVTAGK